MSESCLIAKAAENWDWAGWSLSRKLGPGKRPVLVAEKFQTHFNLPRTAEPSRAEAIRNGFEYSTAVSLFAGRVGERSSNNWDRRVLLQQSRTVLGGEPTARVCGLPLACIPVGLSSCLAERLERQCAALPEGKPQLTAAGAIASGESHYRLNSPVPRYTVSFSVPYHMHLISLPTLSN